MGELGAVPLSPHTRSRLRTLATSLVVLSLCGILNWQLPVLRFESFIANEAALLVLLLLPIVAAILFVRATSGYRRVLTLIALGPLLLFGGCNAALIGLVGLPMSVSDERDASFEPMQRQSFGASDVVLYRTDCGATCSFGLEARQERSLVWGKIKMVRVLDSWYPAEHGQVDRLSDSRVRIRVAASALHRAPASSHEWTLKRWVYF